MSRFFNPSLAGLDPYTPGEQPSGRKFIKLNTNEPPCPPSPLAIEYAKTEAARCNLYPTLDGGELRLKLAEHYGVSPEEVVVTNGSDEVLNFLFKAFCHKDSPAAFADITYGFYSVFAALNGVPFEEIPLRDGFKIAPEDYIGISKNIFIANPNAPTGLVLPLCDIERIAESNPNNIVVIDEAYIDFGGESALGLIKKYGNLVVVRTFSKSRALAGGRVGYAFARPEIISDIYRIIYSTNPYNLSRTDIAMALGALEDEAYTRALVGGIIEQRGRASEELKGLGFELTDSSANFIFAKPNGISAKELYERLKDRGILVRYFDRPRISDRLRITVGSEDEMTALISAAAEIMKGRDGK